LSIGSDETDSLLNFQWLADAVGAADGDLFEPSGEVAETKR
jgi:hypothetical protein